MEDRSKEIDEQYKLGKWLMQNAIGEMNWTAAIQAHASCTKLLELNSNEALIGECTSGQQTICYDKSCPVHGQPA